MPKQIPFHGSFGSADASGLSETNSRVALYPMRSTSAITLDSTDVVAITDFVITVGGTIRVQIYDGSDNSVGAGEEITELVLAANTSGSHHLRTPHECQAGTYPKIKTNASGDVQVTMHGFIERAG